MDEKIVVIEVMGGMAKAVSVPEGVRVVIVDWDVARDGGFDVAEIARMFEHQDMSSDKSLHYAQQIHDEEFDFQNQYEQVMKEFLSGTFDQPFDSDSMKEEV